MLVFKADESDENVSSSRAAYSWKWITGLRVLSTNFHCHSMGQEQLMARIRPNLKEWLEQEAMSVLIFIFKWLTCRCNYLHIQCRIQSFVLIFTAYVYAHTHRYQFRPQHRPFPRVFSCSGGHETVDWLVNYNCCSFPTNNIKLKTNPPAVSMHTFSEAWVSSLEPINDNIEMTHSKPSLKPIWVVFDLGPDAFVASITLELTGENGHNPHHCRLLTSSSTTNPYKGWLSSEAIDFVITSPTLQHYKVFFRCGKKFRKNTCAIY